MENLELSASGIAGIFGDAHITVAREFCSAMNHHWDVYAIQVSISHNVTEHGHAPRFNVSISKNDVYNDA